MASNEQIVKLVRRIVQEEVRKIIPVLIEQVNDIAPALIREAIVGGMGKLVMEAADNNRGVDRRAIAKMADSVNGHKRTSLMEQYQIEDEVDEYETLGGGTMTTETGFRTPVAIRHNSLPGGEITIDAALSDNGNVIPIRPEQVPEAVKAAMNKDYREILKRTLIK
jgi:hypothetical protein